MTVRMKTKRCLGPCERKLPLYQFHKSQRTPDGRGTRCRSCSKVQRETSKRRIRQLGEQHREVMGLPVGPQSLCETRI